MKLSEIITTLQTIHTKHGELWFKIEAIDTDHGGTIVANDFVGIEILDGPENTPDMVMLQVETLTDGPSKIPHFKG